MKKDFIWNSLGTATWAFLSLFLLIIVTRVNGITDSGLFSFAFAFSLIMFTVGCFGGRTYQVSDHRKSFATEKYISLRIITSIAVIFITAGFILLNDYDLQKTILIGLVVAQRILDAVADVFYGIMQKNGYLFISGKSLFYKSILSLVAFLVIDLLTENLLLSTLSLPLISLLFLFLYDIPQSKKLEKFGMKIRVNGTRKILKSTFLSFVVILLGLVFSNISRYFIDIFHPNLQGQFGIIIMPLSLILLLASFTFTPATVRMTSDYSNGKIGSLNKLVIRILLLMATAAILLSILAYFFAAYLLAFLFGVDFTQYSLDIALIILVGLTIATTSLFTNIAIIARKLHVTAVIYIVSNTLLVLLCFSLVHTYQIRGAIISYVVASTLQAIAMGIYYLKLTANHKLSIKS